MATTKSLNSDDSVYVTTYYGAKRGRTYEFVVNLKGAQARRVVTEQQLFELMRNDDFPLRSDNGVRPVFDA
jgi:hypothetical protein